MFNRPLRPLAIKSTILVAALFSLSAMAGKDDFKQIIDLKAEHQNLDAVKKTVIYSGNVNIVQGSLVIKADKVHAIANEDNNTKIIIATGNPAHFKRKMDDGSLVSASAQTITYNVNTRVIKLQGHAQFTQNGSHTSAATITIDMLNEHIEAQGSDDKDGRTHTVLFPDELDKKK